MLSDREFAEKQEELTRIEQQINELANELASARADGSASKPFVPRDPGDERYRTLETKLVLTREKLLGKRNILGKEIHEEKMLREMRKPKREPPKRHLR